MLRNLARQTQLCEAAAAVLVALFALAGGLSAMVLAIPLYAIGAYHRRKMAEIKARQETRIADNTAAAIEGLRRELSALRDTTTQYDVSFDTALRRIDNRVGDLEQRMTQVERQGARPPDSVELRQG